MTKLGAALNAHGIHNTWDLLRLLGTKESDFAVDYTPWDSLSRHPSSTEVWSTRKDLGDHKPVGRRFSTKIFFGKRSLSFTQALEWAKRETKIEWWHKSPLGNEYVPSEVVGRAEEFVKKGSA